MNYKAPRARAMPAAMALAVHLSVFLPWGCTKAPPQEQTQPKGFQGLKETAFIPMSEQGEGSCPGYKGIGLKSFGVILEVAIGSPAEQAGLKVGEMVLNDYVLGRDRYEIGSLLKLKVEDRNGHTREVLVRTAWICEEEKSTPTP